MAKIDSYSLDSSITDNDSVLGIDSASGATKRFTMSSIKAALLEGADITAVIAGTGLSGGATSGEATLTIDNTVVTLTGTQTLTNKTLTSPVISTISNSGTITLPTSTDTLVGRATTDTLTNKTLTTPTLTTPVINAGAQLKNGSTSAGFLEFFEDSDNGTNKVTLIGPASTADVTLTLPAATDTLVGLATTDTLTNKTLTSPSLDAPTFSVTETAIAHGDLILFLDATDSSVTKKESLSDLVALLAGNGLTASSSVLSAGAGTGITVNTNDIAITPAQTAITSVYNASLAVGYGASHANIDFSTDNSIIFDIDGVSQVQLDDGVLKPTTDSDVDLGTSSLYFKDAYIDTITTTGNVSIGGTLSVSGNNFSNVADIGLDSISAATNDINISLTDNRANALTIKQGSDAYMIFDTGNSSESISLGTGISGTAITIGHGTSEVTIGDNLTVTGDLTVQGDTTTVNTATLSVEDPLIILGSGNNSSDSVDLGIYGLYDTSGSQDLYSGLFRDASDSGKWKLFKDLQTAPTTTVNTGGTGYAVGTLVANLEGTVTGNASGLSSTLAVSSGGTNATSFADKAVIITQDSGTDTLAAETMSTNGQLLIGGTSGPAAATLTAGTNVSITNADNSITLDVSAAGDAFKTIAVSGQSDVVADGTADTLTLAAGTGTVITTNASTDTITISAGANVVEINEYTGNGSTTAYTLSSSAVSENELMVYMDGVYQHHNTYAVSGTTLTFDTNVPNGAKVEVYHMRSVNVSNMVQSAIAGSLLDVSSSTGDVTFNVDLTEASEAAIANGDYILFLDGGATGTHAKEAIADVATLFAGTGLTASNSVINIDAAQTGITSLLATDIKIGEDDQTKIDFETADEIHFYANNVEQVYLADNIFGPQSDSDVDLGATGARWKDAYIDTVTTTGNAIIGGNGSSGGVTINDGSIQVRTGTGNVAEIRFYCEVSNAHYQTLKAAPHSAASSAVLVLPTASGTLIGTGDTGTVSTGMLAAALTSQTSMLNTSLVVGRDADNQIKFSTDDQIIFRVAGGDGVTLKASGEIEATSLDISGDVDIDGTLEADAITIDGVTLAETISDTVGAMVGSNTETGISVTYDDSDNTLDFVLGSITSLGTITQDTVTFTSANSQDPLIEIKNTTNDANGARLHFVKDKGAAGADGDDIGVIEFIADDAAQTQTSFAKIVAEVSEADDSDEAGKLSFFVAESDGTNTALTAGLVLEGEHATDGEVDVTIGAGSSSTLSIAGSAYAAGGKFGIDTGDYIHFTADTQTDFYVNGNNEMRLEADGDLHVDGDVIGYSTTVASDEKLKTDVKVIDNALDKLKQINGVTFNYKRNDKPSGGVIAQELEKVLPSVVGTQQSLNGSEEYKTVDYNAVIGLLIESVKELEEKLNNCNCK